MKYEIPPFLILGGQEGIATAAGMNSMRMMHDAYFYYFSSQFTYPVLTYTAYCTWGESNLYYMLCRPLPASRDGDKADFSCSSFCGRGL